DRELGDEYGWKQVHGDVFRSPPHSSLLASLVGTGIHIAVVSSVVLFLALTNKLYTERGSFISTAIFVFATTSPVNGLVGGSLYARMSEVLGLKKYHHKEWISIETLDKIKERKNKKAAINNCRTRAEKVQAQAEYIEANKQVKRSIRADKKKYVEELATTAEKAAREGNMKQLHDTAKKLAGKYSKPERTVKGKEGKRITEIQRQRNRWVEHFEELLNRPAPMNPPDIEAAHIDLPIDVNPPTKEEIRMATKLQHYGSSSKNQLSGTRHYTSTLILKKHSTV
ncbi:unnamed protein product, partial [Schistosoma margrebowiei]